ncbi:unnamed protein product [Effrenium voratum]|uniref:Uncharacterized protein n=1 Tax=Effrenium voratum TaxID=2562239 RepID=A0AA36HRE6_9DINO|nr:unnamed protein product [Effrenium voratum]|mmetsp:Transcript_59947/g.143165  ORF Transcript_59947/g.143165 Transcript_59947/m.143165 type:complete len:113 (-) Transcript_59947:133-471(-)
MMLIRLLLVTLALGVREDSDIRLTTNVKEPAVNKDGYKCCEMRSGEGEPGDYGGLCFVTDTEPCSEHVAGERDLTFDEVQNVPDEEVKKNCNTQCTLAEVGGSAAVPSAAGA